MTDLFADLSAVQARIALLSGEPIDSTRFAGALSAAQRSADAVRPYGASTARGRAGSVPREIDELVQRNATTWQVDAALITAVIANESGFNTVATSASGAQGLMQLMPATSAALGVRNAYDPAQNVAAGTRYLRGLLDRFGGDARLAVAAYNAGPAAVEKYGDVPPYAETRTYVRNVLASYEAYDAIP